MANSLDERFSSEFDDWRDQWVAVNGEPPDPRQTARAIWDRAAAAEARAEAAEAEVKRLRGFAQRARDIAIADRQSPQREIETVIRLARAALSPAEEDASSGSAERGVSTMTEERGERACLVVKAAKQWWVTKRPWQYTERMHLANPVVNLSSSADMELALCVAEWVRDFDLDHNDPGEKTGVGELPHW